MRVFREGRGGFKGEGIRPAAKYPVLPSCVTDECEARLQECPDSGERDYQQTQRGPFSREG